jgi:hypothetical protein
MENEEFELPIIGDSNTDQEIDLPIIGEKPKKQPSLPRLPANMNPQQVKSFFSRAGKSLTDTQAGDIAGLVSGKSYEEAMSLTSNYLAPKVAAPVQEQAPLVAAPRPGTGFRGEIEGVQINTTQNQEPDLTFNTVGAEIARPKSPEEINLNISQTMIDEYKAADKDLEWIFDAIDNGKIPGAEISAVGNYLGQAPLENKILGLTGAEIAQLSLPEKEQLKIAVRRNHSAKGTVDFISNYATIKSLQEESTKNMFNLTTEVTQMLGDPQADKALLKKKQDELYDQIIINRVSNEVQEPFQKKQHKKDVQTASDLLDSMPAAYRAAVFLESNVEDLYGMALSLANSVAESMTSGSGAFTFDDPEYNEKLKNNPDPIAVAAKQFVVNRKKELEDYKKLNPITALASEVSILDGLNAANGGHAVGQLVASMGTVIAATYSGGPVAGFMAGYGMMYGDLKDDARLAGFEEDEAEIFAKAVAIGNGFLEFVPVQGLLKGWEREMLKTSTLQFIRSQTKARVPKTEIINSLLKRTYESAQKALARGIPEGTTEVFQNTQEQATKLAFNEFVKDKEDPGFQIPTMAEFGKQTAENFVLGMFGTGGISVAGDVISGTQTYEKIASAAIRDNEAFNNLNLVADGLLTSGKISQQERDSFVENLKIAKEAKAAIPKYIKDDAVRQRSIELILDKKRIEADMSTVDPSMLDGYRARLISIQAELKSIADQKWTAPANPVLFESISGLEAMTKALVTNSSKQNAAGTFVSTVQSGKGFISNLVSSLENSEPIPKNKVERTINALETLANSFSSAPVKTELTEKAAQQAQEIADQLKSYSYIEETVEEKIIPGLDISLVADRIALGVPIADLDFMGDVPTDIQETYQGIVNGDEVSSDDANNVQEVLYSKYKELSDVKQRMQDKLENTTSKEKQQKLNESIEAISEIQAKLGEDITMIDRYKKETRINEEATGLKPESRTKPVVKQERQQKQTQQEPTEKQGKLSEQELADMEYDYSNPSEDTSNIIDEQPDASKIYKLLNNAIKFINKIAPNVKIYVHSTSQEFYDSVYSTSGANEHNLSDDAAFVMGNDGKPKAVHFNLAAMLGKKNPKERAEALRTFAHEAMHVGLHTIFGNDQNLFKSFQGKLSKVLESADLASLNDFIKNYRDPNKQDITAEEFLAELGGMMSAEGRKIPKPILARIAQLINNTIVSAARKLGITVDSNLLFKDTMDTNDVIDFFNTMAESTRTGITQEVKAKTEPLVKQQIRQANETEQPTGTRARAAEEQRKAAPAGNRLFNEPLAEAKRIADKYFESTFGRKKPNYTGTRVLDVENAKRISDAFIAMKHAPQDLEVARAYRQMIKETEDQYNAIIDAGYSVVVNNTEPYKNSNEMINDLRNNKSVKIFSTESAFGDTPITEEQRRDNPLLAKTKYKDANGVPLLANDLFRFVHDFFGHSELGNSFGAKGEENAWNVHARMYSPLARRAMTTETRGQNSFVNFSGINEKVDKLREKVRKQREEGDEAGAMESANELYELTTFADQKVGLLPEEFSMIDETDEGDRQEELGLPAPTTRARRAEEAKPASKSVKDIDVNQIRTLNRPGAKISKGLSVKTVKGEKIVEEAEDLSIDYVKEKAPEIYISNANILAEYPIVAAELEAKEISTIEDAEKVYDIFIRKTADNLNFLINNFDKKFREISTLWYDGANILAQNLSSKYGVSKEQVAGMIASLSPQKDWYQNVRLAEMVMMAFKENPVMTKQMVEKQKLINIEGLKDLRKDVKKADEKFQAEPTTKNRKILKEEKARLNDKIKKLDAVIKSLNSLVGKKMNEADNGLKCYYVRLWNEGNTTKDYDVLRPDGEVVGVAKKKNGENAKIAWGSYTEIGKATAIYMDGSQENITKTLGEMHKIRNFYNNIIDPMSLDNDVTMDTHAVAASLLSALSGNSKQVKQNFGEGTSNSAGLGIKGLYYAFAEGYKLSAKENKLLPRQVQSITWEAVRGLFTDTFKNNKANVAEVNKIWKQYEDGEITIEQARDEVVKFAGGIKNPTWSGSIQTGAGTDVGTGDITGGDGRTGQDIIGESEGGRGGVTRARRSQVEDIVRYDPIESIKDKDMDTLGDVLNSKKISPLAEPEITDFGDTVVFEYNNMDEDDTKTRITFNRNNNGTLSSSGVKVEKNTGSIRGTDRFAKYIASQSTADQETTTRARRTQSSQQYYNTARATDQGTKADRDNQVKIYDKAKAFLDNFYASGGVKDDEHEALYIGLSDDGIDLNPNDLFQLRFDIKEGNRPKFGENKGGQGFAQQEGTKTRKSSVLDRIKTKLEKLGSDKSLNRKIINKLKESLHYTVQNQDDAMRIAQMVVDEFGGIDGPQDVQDLYDLSNEFSGAVKTFIVGNVLNEAYKLAKKAAKGSAEQLRYQQIINSSSSLLAERARDNGREIAALYKLYLNSPEGMYTIEAKKFLQDVESAFGSKTQKAKIDALLKELKDAKDEAARLATEVASVRAAIATATGGPVTTPPKPGKPTTPKPPKPPKPQTTPATPTQENLKKERSLFQQLKDRLKSLGNTRARRQYPAGVDADVVDILAELARVNFERGIFDFYDIKDAIAKKLAKDNMTISDAHYTEMWNDIWREAGNAQIAFNAEILAKRIVFKAKQTAPTSAPMTDPIKLIKDELFKRATQDIKDFDVDNETEFDKLRRLLFFYGSMTKPIWNESKDAVRRQIDALDPTKYSDAAKAELRRKLDTFFNDTIANALPRSQKKITATFAEDVKDKQLKIQDILLKPNETIASNREEFVADLVDRIVSGAGVSYADAQAITEAFTKEYDALAQKTSEKILARSIPKTKSKEKILNKSKAEKAFEMIKYGAIDQNASLTDKDGNLTDLNDLFSDIFGLPKMNDEIRGNLKAFAEQIAKTKPNSILRQQFYNDMMSYIEFQKIRDSMGLNIFMSQIYHNVLFSMDTMVKAFNSNFINTPHEFITQSLRAAAEGDFSLIPLIAKSYFGKKGDKTSGVWFREGMNNAKLTLSGMVETENFNTTNIAEVLSKQSDSPALKAWGKYARKSNRFLGAIDTLFTSAATGARITDLLYDEIKYLAKQNNVKLSSREISETVANIQGLKNAPVKDAIAQATDEFVEAYGPGVDINSKKNIALFRARVMEIVREGTRDRAAAYIVRNQWASELDGARIDEIISTAKELASKVGLVGNPPGTFGVLASILKYPGKVMPGSQVVIGNMFANAPMNAAEKILQGNTLVGGIVLAVRLAKNQRGILNSSDVASEILNKEGIRTEMYGRVTSTVLGRDVNMEKKEMIVRYVMLQALVLPISYLSTTAIAGAIAKALDDDDERKEDIIKNHIAGVGKISENERQMLFFGDKTADPGTEEYNGQWKNLKLYVTGPMYGYTATGAYSKMSAMKSMYGIEPYSVYSYGKLVTRYNDNPLLAAVFGSVGANNDVMLFNNNPEKPTETYTQMMMQSAFLQLNLVKDQAAIKPVMEFADALGGTGAYGAPDLESMGDRAKLLAQKKLGNLISNLTLPAEAKNFNQDIKSIMGVAADDPRELYEFITFRAPIIDLIINKEKTDSFGFPIEEKTKRVLPVGTQGLMYVRLPNGGLQFPQVDQIMNGPGGKYYAMFKKYDNDLFDKPGISSYVERDPNNSGESKVKKLNKAQLELVRDEYKKLMREFCDYNYEELKSGKSKMEFDLRLNLFLSFYNNSVDGYKDYIIKKVIGENAFVDEPIEENIEENIDEQFRTRE